MLFYSPEHKQFVDVTYPIPGRFSDGTEGWMAFPEARVPLFRFNAAHSSLLALTECYTRIHAEFMLPFTPTIDASRMAMDSSAARCSYQSRQ